MSLIDWDDPDDALRRIVVPDMRELETWGCMDPSNESIYKITPSLEHKYPAVALLLVSGMCGSFCRFCFRKRLFMNSNTEVNRDLSREIEYIRRHREITNVLLTGGDPLVLSTPKLDEIIKQVHNIDHVQIIRIGTKMPAFDPFRIINDSALLDTIDKYSSGDKKIYVMTHFNHPRELTDAAVEAMDLLKGAGAVAANQTPLVSGVNDDPAVLADLFNKLAFIGIPSYYVFQCRPTLGNKAYCRNDRARVPGFRGSKKALFRACTQGPVRDVAFHRQDRNYWNDPEIHIVQVYSGCRS